jgi:Holliday junction resolvasome RuvABC ATP-dependent DNA helicase subunit
METTYFDEMIGQDKTKRVLSFYIDAFEKSEILPHLFVVGQRGQGKTMLATQVAKNLRSKTLGRVKPMLTINCSTLKNVRQFVEDIALTYIRDQHITVFFDEAHEMPESVQTCMLTVLNPNKHNRNTLRFDDYNIEFDFTKVSFIFATTDPQKVITPLKDRCKMIHMEEYNYSDLAKIVENNSDDITYSPEVLEEISSTCRGNARNATLMAKDNITQFAKRHNIYDIDKRAWKELKCVLGILPLGLENTELQLLKVLKERGSCSLTNLSAVTGLSGNALRSEFELYLLKHGLMEVAQGGRRITAKGAEYLRALDNECADEQKSLPAATETIILDMNE